MKNGIISFAFLAFAVFGAQAVTVKSVTANQDWPWSTDIKVKYVLSDVSDPVDLTVTAMNGATALPVPAKAIKGDLYGIVSDKGTLTIDPVAAFGTAQAALADLRIEVSAAASPANINEALYKIFDLATGDCTDVTRKDLLNGKWGSVETDYKAIDQDFTTDAKDVLIWTAVTNDVRYKTTHLVVRKINAAGKVWHSGDTEGYVKYNMSSSPRSWIKLTYDYYVGVFEVTLEQWKRVFGSYPTDCAKGPEGSEYLVPANYNYYYHIIGYTMSDYASYNTVVSNEKLYFPNNTYVRDVGKQTFLSVMWTRTKCEFTLPTQAEWEFASRGGTDATLYSGESQTSAHVEKLAWTAADGACLHVVGLKKPNAYGLYDTLGNAMERQLSRGDLNAGATSGSGETEEDPAIDPIGSVTTARDQIGPAYGGGSLSDAGQWQDCRSGARIGWMGYGNARKDGGFRVVMPARADGQWADHPVK